MRAQGWATQAHSEPFIPHQAHVFAVQRGGVGSFSNESPTNQNGETPADKTGYHIKRNSTQFSFLAQA